MAMPRIIPTAADEESATEEQLLTLGRERGYVTLEDIIAAFPEAENDMDRLNEVLGTLMENSIEVGEQPEQEPSEIEDEEAVDEPDEETLTAVETDDTVELYLKEIGRVPLLTAQEEVDLAKRIARAKSAAKQLAAHRLNPRQRARLKAMVADGSVAREHLIAANTGWKTRSYMGAYRR